MKELFARAAFLTSAAYHGLWAYTDLAHPPPSPLAVNGRLVAFSVLFTVAGARAASGRRIARAGIAFVVVFAVVFGARFYSDVLFGNQSVMDRGLICSLNHSQRIARQVQPARSRPYESPIAATTRRHAEPLVVKGSEAALQSSD
jgi:hypothetical protein